jgi:predicted nucleic acid-binding protein
MPKIADAGFLIAYLSERDAYHAWARGVAQEAPLLTCGPVLTETAYMIRAPERVLQMIVDGDLSEDFDVGLHAKYLLLWLQKYADLDPGLADACVVALADQTPDSEVLTADRRHFSAYRILAGKPLNCIFPPVE